MINYDITKQGRDSQIMCAAIGEYCTESKPAHDTNDDAVWGAVCGMDWPRGWIRYTGEARCTDERIREVYDRWLAKNKPEVICLDDCMECRWGE